MSTGLADPATLQAVSVALPCEGVDPVGVCGASGVLVADGQLSLAGRGLAARLDLPAGLDDAESLSSAQEWLSAVAHTDRSEAGAGVRAFGALPFERGAPAALLVPELTVGRRADGRCWATLVVSGDAEERAAGLVAEVEGLARTRRARPGGDAVAEPELVEIPSPAGYSRAVEHALSAIAAGSLRKVVLARRVEARFPAPLDVAVALGRLWAQEPGCTIFSFPSGSGSARFIGASPELLVDRRGSTVACHPLAGTVALAGDGSDDDAIAAFLASTKDLLEHELVVEAIEETLARRCTELKVPSVPSLVRLHTVAHLGTSIEGTLSAMQDGRPPSALDLLAELHPTPAVGGLPRREALACIAELEPDGRGQWAGPVGWVDGDGDGRWVIGIRSATLDGTTATLSAGAGIVAGSDPSVEVAETTVKLAPVLDALSPTASRLL